MTAYVYVLTSRKHGTLYIGCTTNLAKRLEDHKTKAAEGFTKKYNVTMLVHTEEFATLEEALVRERAMKAWQRAWKVKLIASHNPEWQDLSPLLT